VAAPAFAVAGVFKETINESPEGVWGSVVLEGDDLLVRGRNSEEVEVGAADEGAFVCGGFSRCCGEFVEGFRGRFWGDEGPVRWGFGEEFFDGGGFPISVARVRCAVTNPLFEVRNHGVRESLFWRHLEVALMLERFEDQAFVGSAWNDGWTGVAAGEEPFTGVEDEPALLFFVSAVAFVAVFDERGTDF
jgi:hypothetical protein